MQNSGLILLCCLLGRIRGALLRETTKSAIAEVSVLTHTRIVFLGLLQGILHGFGRGGAAVNAVSLVTGESLDVAFRGELDLVVPPNLEVDVGGRTPGVRDWLDGPEVILCAEIRARNYPGRVRAWPLRCDIFMPL